MTEYPIHIGVGAIPALIRLLENSNYSQIIVLSDDNTARACYPLIQSELPPHIHITVPAGEAHKNLETCTNIWEQMTQANIDRKAIMLNLGGGVIGDMGGMAAGLYKRGIDFIQIPTTLLSQVDASVGGKLGIDFHGFKNHIGLFREPKGVFIEPEFLKTLPESEIRSGFAEIVKHHLIADKAAWAELQLQQRMQDWNLTQLIQHSVAIKARIVEADPLERGIRKALNFGHTIGHAVESTFLEAGEPMLHGDAVAIGMICESWIAHTLRLISDQELEAITAYIQAVYPFRQIPMEWQEEILDRTRNDKKNEGGLILCSLLEGIGKAAVNQPITREQIADALAYYRQLGQANAT
ncbi:3-dehydroquinate synthase [Pontibacter sp. G13]|uniref:3-dehydroquinate synthase n=1 Tax=Pontibacter sp. G13 TaxID=3074898 RepID=UPI00288974BB|nr:3-dehydroquinate synthase [Pontibacter sp. G13]WNJ21296.1 3-dehydroquinate synthase [Pontibacter sp. G13]